MRYLKCAGAAALYQFMRRLCLGLMFAVFGISAAIAAERLSLPAEIEALRPSLPESVDFNFHIKPILSDRCYICHGPDENHRMVNLRLDTQDGAYGPLLIGPGTAVVPHKPDESVLLHRVLSSDSGRIMPPAASNLALNDYEKALLVKWIEQGGEYKPHWSFIPLSQSLASPSFPKDENLNIDFFIQKRLAEHGFSFSPEADRETLLRRVTFDLTGLPPAPEEIDAFVNDSSPDAYEKVVDLLLDSPHYGERMAMDWLDLARYSDTYGYQADNYRPAWRWRDWVIQAFNENMPYDRFVTWQLAGDLLPNPSQDQILATGFNRNHAQNAEGGIINEEYRVEYAADRANTFGKAFLGMTFECARCHDHKYDPISHEDYYSLFSFFNNVDESGQITWTQHDIPPPSLLLLTDDDQARMKDLDDRIGQIERSIKKLSSTQTQAFARWREEAKQSPDPERILPQHRIAYITLDSWTNELIPNEIGDATGQLVDPVPLRLTDTQLKVVEGKRNRAVQFDGDMMMDFPAIGRFARAEPFTIGMWVNIPEELKQGVIFHSNRGAIIYSFKGYQVSIEEGRFDIRLAHSFPFNAIHLLTESAAPRNEWIHIALTYDGSGKASGVRFYVNGEPQALQVKRDNLYKDIVFIKDDIKTNLRIGARWRSRGFTNGLLDEIAVYDQELSPLAVGTLSGQNRLTALLQKTIDDLCEEEREELFTYYLRNFDPEYLCLQENLRELRQERNTIQEDAEEVMVMAEMPEQRPAYVLLRGVYDAYGERVYPRTPESILPFPAELPKDRLGLAHWLFHADNPLTARVTANRIWQQFFGRGIVKTTEDFGSQGDLPSHPHLLDWLASQLIESGWNLKSLQREIVLSRTYRQSSIATPELREKDPENIWLARGPKTRLSAEMLRDSALAASGLLVREIGGPSVKPYQPEGLWSFGSNRNYEQDHGEKLYRRSLYTFWKRTIPPPSMNIFDAPARSECTVRRQQTSTPLQSLVLLNDPQFVEAARVLAARMLAQPLESTEERITYAFRLLTSRTPTSLELHILSELYKDQRNAFEQESAAVEGLLATGEYKHSESLDRIELAACTIVASTIMNADLFIVKR